MRITFDPAARADLDDIFTWISRDQERSGLVIQFPRVTYRGGGDPNIGGKNKDVMLNLEFTASKDANTSAVIVLDRLEYVLARARRRVIEIILATSGVGEPQQDR